MRTEHYQIITLVFFVLLLLSLTFNFIPNNEQQKYDKLCRSAALDYAKLDLTFAKFQCCSIHKVSDPQLNMTYESEGCTRSFDFING